MLAYLRHYSSQIFAMKLKPWSAISKLNFVVIERRTMRWHIMYYEVCAGQAFSCQANSEIIEATHNYSPWSNVHKTWRSYLKMTITDQWSINTRNIRSIVADVLHLPERFWTSSAQIIIAINWFESCIPAKIIYHCLRAKLFLFHVFVCLHTHNIKKKWLRIEH